MNKIIVLAAFLMAGNLYAINDSIKIAVINIETSELECHFVVENNIKLRTKEGKTVKGVLKQISRDAISIDDQVISLTDVESIYRKRKHSSKVSSALGISIIPLFLASIY